MNDANANFSVGNCECKYATKRLHMCHYADAAECKIHGSIWIHDKS